MEKMKHLGVLIKPVSGACNLHCTYCFYRDEIKNREQRFSAMTVDTLEKIMCNLVTSCTESCVIGFQGGEPLLAGLPFFHKVIEFGKQFNSNNTKIFYTVQTNGTLLDTEWADFFMENNVLVGLSLDGTKEIHDRWRGRGTHEKVLKAAEIMDSTGVKYNITSVVTADLAMSIREVYEYYRIKGFNYLQFINCLDPLNEIPGEHPYSLTPEAYAYFLKALFDLWYQDLLQDRYVYIRDFNDIVNRLLGEQSDCCNHNGFCSMQNVIEADGSVYPCDFYVLARYKIGNYAEENAVQLFNKGMNSEFVTSSYAHSEECKQCKYYSLCRGGCRRERINQEGVPGVNRLCAAYKDFYSYSLSRFIRIAEWMKYCK